MPPKDQIDKIWNKAKEVRGEDPDEIRQDSYGDKFRRCCYAHSLLKALCAQSEKSAEKGEY